MLVVEWANVCEGQRLLGCVVRRAKDDLQMQRILIYLAKTHAIRPESPNVQLYVLQENDKSSSDCAIGCG